MIDVWGGLFHDGYHHLLYDLNTRPCVALGGTFCHLRSHDLLHFEQLPPALTPSAKRNELRLNDGCIAFRNDGTPLMYYTSVFNGETKPREHLPVIGTPDLVRWERLPDETALTLDNHGGPRFHNGWSDPIIFTCNSQTFMLISKCVTLDGKNQIPIYEATDDSLLHWRYKGVFFDNTGEVINFVKIGEKWVLIYCPYADPVWFVGSFDPETCRFTAEQRGTLSRGYISQGNEHGDISRGFYATSTHLGAKGEHVIFGWLSGFHSPAGWDGCISFPRTLSVDTDGLLHMNPHPSLAQLRQTPRLVLPDVPQNSNGSFELECDYALSMDGSLTLTVGNSLKMQLNEREIFVNNVKLELRNPPVTNGHFRLFVDVTTVELFAENGLANLSLAIQYIKNDDMLNLTLQGNATIHSATLYPLELN